jgi:glycosyltransferase involved in cell wall biosynthesis
MLGAGFDHSRVVRMVNGVDVHKFSPSIDKRIEKKNLSVEGKRVLLYTGRLTSQKSLKTLLFAFHRSIEVIPNLYLFFVGDGEDRSMLEALAVELGIQDNVAFVRWTEDITTYLRGADIFVLPSLSEGISNSLLEAMAAGLPCIATNVGGSGETLGQDNNYGILVEPGNIDQLSEAINRLAANDQEALEFGARARQRILEHYELSVVGDRYFELYEKLVMRSRN